MQDFNVFVKRFDGLSNYLKKKSPELLMKEQQEIIALNKKQLLAGKNREGEIMQRGYSPGYAKKRKKAGLQTGYVDLKFTGKYQGGFRGVKQTHGMDIQSDVDYGWYLRGNFPKHLGLTEQDAKKIAALLSDDIAVLIDKYFA